MAKYARLLEEREICYKTGEIWRLQDVPSLWRNKVKKKVIEDGYYFGEDGTAYKNDYVEK